MYGIEPTATNYWVQSSETWHEEIWLHEDSARVFDLAMENDLMIGSCVYTNMVKVFFEVKNASVFEIWEKYADHNNDRKQAARIAAMKALKAKAESKKEGER